MQHAPIESRPFLVTESAAAPPNIRPEFVLPVMPRSAVLFHLLLQDNAIDLGLASSVVALDVGLAFGVIQLANPVCGEGDLVWQLPSAVVAAGRESLLDLLERAPRLDPQLSSNGRQRLSAMMRDAVVRACLAQWLARQLGKCNTKKAYLGGLLFDIPKMVAATRKVHDGYRAQLLSIMCNSLPATLVRAALTEVDDDGEVSDPLLATILLAELQVRGRNAPADTPLWDCWPDFNAEQRACVLETCGKLASWAGENFMRMDPWEFMSRMERSSGQWSVVSSQ